MKFIFELLMKEKNDHPSKISNLRKEACKNQCFNGIQTCGLREYRWCDALPTELWSDTLWTRSKVINLTQSNLNLTYFGIVLLCNEALKMCLYLFTPPRSDKFTSSIYPCNIWRPFMFIGRNTQLKYMNSMGCKGCGFESRSKTEFFQVIFPEVLWLHSHLLFFHYF